MEGVQFQVDYAGAQIHGWSWSILLEACDVVPGVERLKKYNLVLFDLSQLSLTFTKEGKTVLLKGTAESAELHVIGSHGLQKVLTMGLLFSLTTETANQVTVPPPIYSLLQEFRDVFCQPEALPPTKTQEHIPPLPNANLYN